jgi:hypothetical protein
MLNRRDFIAAAATASLAPLIGSSPAEAAEGPKDPRDVYELRQYQLANEDQKKGFDAFMRSAAIPALNRIGISPVGVFYSVKDLSPAYVLMRHRSLESFLTGTQKLLADAEFLAQGAEFMNAPADKPAFQRMESSILLAFKGMPQIETPAKGPGRVFQLRTYESPSVKTGQKKIEMFNDAGEIAIFRRVGLHPVFFGEALAGGKMPNLTYMLGFESEADQASGWKKFGADPDWQKLRGMAEYSDKAILCGITNIVVKPAGYSQV